MDFREELIKKRHLTHLSQRRLAALADVSQTAVSWLELGKGIPREKTLKAILRALDAAIAEIQVRTNGDAIRMMPDEELVFAINCQQIECKISPPDRDCYQCKLNYLKREGKGGVA